MYESIVRRNLKQASLSSIHTVRYFQCHRSGAKSEKSKVVHDQTDQKTSRNRGLIGSKKTGRCCPAFLIKNEHTDSRITVKFTLTHAGHENEVAFQSLTKEEEAEIVQKLKVGVPKDRILQDLHSRQSERASVTTLKDLFNLELKHGLKKAARLDPDDLVSVEKLIQTCDSHHLQILGYKRAGVESEQFDHLKKDDFLLAFMSNYQVDCCKHLLSNNLKIFCFDGSHKLTKYDLIYVSILIKDENHQGFPLAQAFVSAERYDCIRQFFELFRAKIGVIKTKVVMTDDFPSFFKAWVEVMNDGDPVESHPVKLICSWHVNKNFNKNLNKIPANHYLTENEEE